ncbi:unnamed protein product [Soboliphyme baturini]|uniref:DUF1559 domain-containing protein n=1 Tax=Soboliphyme baturini TaxID=241478 RepID=A0A183IRV0_9BILA|nr:unnamed protein product [Soboliphyme baturini]
MWPPGNDASFVSAPLASGVSKRNDYEAVVADADASGMKNRPVGRNLISVANFSASDEPSIFGTSATFGREDDDNRR